MDFDLTLEQQMMVETAEQISARFDPEYWREKDESGEFPAAFMAEIGAQGFFGLPVPEQYGGMGLGLTELAVAMEGLCRGGGGGGRPDRAQGQGLSGAKLDEARSWVQTELDEALG